MFPNPHQCFPVIYISSSGLTFLSPTVSPSLSPPPPMLVSPLQWSSKNCRSAVFRVGRSTPQTAPSRSLFVNTTRPKDEPGKAARDGKVLRMVMFGKPGAGKGTLSSKLVKKYDIMSLSTGDILRQNILERYGKPFTRELLSVDLYLPFKHRGWNNGRGTRETRRARF